MRCRGCPDVRRSPLNNLRKTTGGCFQPRCSRHAVFRSEIYLLRRVEDLSAGWSACGTWVYEECEPAPKGRQSLERPWSRQFVWLGREFLPPLTGRTVLVC